MEKQVELNRKLAEWARFSKGYVGIKPAQLEVWLAPAQKMPTTPQEFYHSGNSYDLPNFTDPELGIAYCFKYLEPKLDKGYDIYVSRHWDREGFSCVISNVNKPEFRDIFAKADTPALAFCLAIDKLIDGEK